MRTLVLRRFLFSLVLGLALVAGQHAAQLHDLGHAVKRVQTGSQEQHPGTDTCDKCSLYAPFSGAASAYLAVVAITAAIIVAALFSFIPALSRTIVSSRSRAPPCAT